MGICSGISTEWLFTHCFRIELEFGVLIFVEGGKPEHPGRDEGREPTTNSTHMSRRVRESNRATAVGGERSHHCAIPAPLLAYAKSVSATDFFAVETEF